MATRQYGIESGGGFNAPSGTYKADPTIETYVGLRRSDPQADIDVAGLGCTLVVSCARKDAPAS